jgi:hypothetical protein
MCSNTKKLAVIYHAVYCEQNITPPHKTGTVLGRTSCTTRMSRMYKVIAGTYRTFSGYEFRPFSNGMNCLIVYEDVEREA